MNIKKLRNDYVRLSAKNGVIDSRNGKVFFEITTKSKNIKYFRENTQ